MRKCSSELKDSGCPGGVVIRTEMDLIFFSFTIQGAGAAAAEVIVVCADHHVLARASWNQGEHIPINFLHVFDCSGDLNGRVQIETSFGVRVFLIELRLDRFQVFTSSCKQSVCNIRADAYGDDAGAGQGGVE